MNTIFQGDNETLSLIMKDNDGNAIDSSLIVDMVAVLYLEHNRKPYVYWCLNGGSIYDRNKYVDLTNQQMSKSDDGYTIDFNLESSDTSSMKLGRYIIQVSYNITSDDLSSGKFITDYGALLSLKKLN